ncbi:MAG: hypothetical protein ACKOA9_05885, partial [Actinomycetota bacterium]
HQMAKAADPPGQVRRWVEAVMSQAEGDVAATTRAVIWNAGGGLSGAPAASTGPIATPLHAPLAALGSRSPELDANLLAHATVGRLGEHLFARTQPTRAEVDHLVAVGLAVAGAGAGAPARRLDSAGRNSPESRPPEFSSA